MDAEVVINELKDCQQMTFIMLHRFCLLSEKKTSPPLFLMDNIKMDKIPTKNMKNVHPFYIVFQVLKVLIKICKMQPPDLLLLVVLY